MAKTYAEHTAEIGTRDDEHMIYEMGPITQYEDGSVLECISMTTYTAAEVAAGITVEPHGMFQRTKLYEKDLRRNAEAAIKNGKTENFAPFVN